MPSRIESMFDLAGRTAVISGGSKGLGRQIGSILAEAGAKVVLASRNGAACREAAAELQARGHQAAGADLDVSTRTAVEKFAESVTGEHGPVHILVNAAGVQHRQASVDFDEDAWNHVIGTNLSGTFFMCQAFGRRMVEAGGGKIVNIGSLASHIGLAGRAAYTSSKGGVLVLTRTLALEWARHGINVNAIGPGYFRTEMNTALFDNPEWVAKVMQYIPMKREGSPPDLEGTALYLCSNASDYMTGQILYVDGGFMAGPEL